MLGDFVEAVGVPAAILSGSRSGVLLVEHANTLLAAAVGSDQSLIRGQSAETLLPRAAVAAMLQILPEAPIDTRLGPSALPYRAVIRRLPVTARRRRLLVTFLAAPDGFALLEFEPVRARSR